MPKSIPGCYGAPYSAASYAFLTSACASGNTPSWTGIGACYSYSLGSGYSYLGS